MVHIGIDIGTESVRVCGVSKFEPITLEEPLSRNVDGPCHTMSGEKLWTTICTMVEQACQMAVARDNEGEKEEKNETENQMSRMDSEIYPVGRIEERDWVDGEEVYSFVPRQPDGNINTYLGTDTTTTTEYENPSSLQDRARNSPRSSNISQSAELNSDSFSRSSNSPNTATSSTSSSSNTICVAATCSMVAMQRTTIKNTSYYRALVPGQEVFVWMDSRASSEARQLSRLLPPSALAQVGGSVTPEMGVAKMMWVNNRHHDVVVFELYDWISYLFVAGGIHDGLVRCLEGDLATFPPGLTAMDGSVKGWGDELMKDLGIEVKVGHVPKRVGQRSKGESTIGEKRHRENRRGEEGGEKPGANDPSGSKTLSERRSHHLEMETNYRSETVANFLRDHSSASDDVNTGLDLATSPSTCGSGFEYVGTPLARCPPGSSVAGYIVCHGCIDCYGGWAGNQVKGLTVSLALTLDPSLTFSHDLAQGVALALELSNNCHRKGFHRKGVHSQCLCWHHLENKEINQGGPNNEDGAANKVLSRSEAKCNPFELTRVVSAQTTDSDNIRSSQFNQYSLSASSDYQVYHACQSEVGAKITNCAAFAPIHKAQSSASPAPVPAPVPARVPMPVPAMLKRDPLTIKAALYMVAGTLTCFIADVLSPHPLSVSGLWGPFRQLAPRTVYSFGQPATGLLFDELFAAHPSLIGEQNPFRLVEARAKTMEASFGVLLTVLTRQYLYYGDKHGNRSPYGDFAMSDVLVDGVNAATASSQDLLACDLSDNSFDSLVVKYYLILEHLVFQTFQLANMLQNATSLLDTVIVCGSQAHNLRFTRMLSEFAFTHALVMVGSSAKYAGAQGVAFAGASALKNSHNLQLLRAPALHTEHVEATPLDPRDIGILKVKYAYWQRLAQWQAEFRTAMAEA